jgi:hypothetical protein
MRYVLRILRWLTVVGVGSVAGGLVLGLWGRAAMRVVAVVDPTTSPSFTVGGTVAILIVAVILSLPAAMLFLGLRRFLGQGEARQSAAFGLALLAFPGLLFLLRFGELHELGLLWLNVGMFGAMFVAWGGSVAAGVTWADRRLPGRRRPPSGQPDRPEVVARPDRDPVGLLPRA